MSENPSFENQSIRKSYFSFALPVVFGMVISIIYNIADTYFIARTNNTELIAAVSFCAPVFTFLMALGNIYGQGGTSLISRLLGKKEYDDIKRISSYCFYMAAAIGVITGVVMLIGRDFILRKLGVDDASFSYACDYFTWMAIGAPFVVLSFVHSNLMRAEGMSKESVIGSVSGSIINIILDPILIFSCNLGISGAAIATVVGYIFSDIFCLIVVLKKTKVLSIDIRKARVNWRHKGQILSIGTSSALSNITQTICVILTNHFMVEYGNDKIAIAGIVTKISMVIMLLIIGCSFGGIPLIGYFYGAGNKNKLRELLGFVFKFLSTLAISLTLIFVVLAPVFVSAFLHDAEAIKLGATILRWQVVGMEFMAIVLFSQLIFQACGAPVSALTMSLSRQGYVFVVVIVVASQLLGFTGVIAAQAVSDVISAIIAVILLSIWNSKEKVLFKF